jgi:N-acetylmuramic acid 6-phosphate etherase
MTTNSGGTVSPEEHSKTLDEYTTEQRNESSLDIDSASSLEILTIINGEDKKVPLAVETILPEIAALVDDVVGAFKKGGRLFYIGAGTSGRLGVLDASECPPTYGVSPEMVQGIIAGGREALTRSIESAEDRAEEGVGDLKKTNFGKNDVLVGITASGQAPYVLGALEYAKKIGAVTAAISCNRNSRTFDIAGHKLFVNVGPEVVTGSTRMKSGTAQKLILNMISTASMIRLGKVYKNLMVDLKPVNHKLILRSIRLIREVTGCSEEKAREALESSASGSVKNPKAAIVMVLLGKSREEALALLEKSGGHISALVEKGQGAD